MIIKITGFILLALGLVIILGSLYSSYNIFTGTTEIPQIFNFSQQITNTSLDQNSDLQQQLNNIIGDKINNMIPQDGLSYICWKPNIQSWNKTNKIINVKFFENIRKKYIIQMDCLAFYRDSDGNYKWLEKYS